MTPAARVQAAIELLDNIIAAATAAGAAADTIIARYFKMRRYAGAKDRRAVRDLVYRAIRRSGERPVSGRAAMLGLAEDDPELLAHFTGELHAPLPVRDGEERAAASSIPSWLEGRFDPLITAADYPALLARAPLDVRVNELKSSLAEVQVVLSGAERTALSPIGLRFAESFAVEAHPLWRSGAVEVQDEGSQLAALACAAEPGMHVVDLCAGAGGKTLALAAQMANKGRIIACDTDRARLSRMRERLDRAGVSIVEPRLLAPAAELDALGDLKGAADIVLVDAPCSGSGTWRRNPETRWRLDSKRLDRLTRLQTHLLDIALELIAPHGSIIYAVCSLLVAEGRTQAANWGARHSSLVSENLPISGGRPAGSGRLLTPGHDCTDGFFIARWQLSC